MSEKFTPGPWYLEFDNCDEDGFLEGAEFTGAIVGADGEGILQVYSKANAHLIAAAPEMYEALQAILPYVPISSASEGGAVARSWNVIAADKVRAALKKARGES